MYLVSTKKPKVRKNFYHPLVAVFVGTYSQAQTAGADGCCRAMRWIRSWTQYSSVSGTSLVHSKICLKSSLLHDVSSLTFLVELLVICVKACTKVRAMLWTWLSAKTNDQYVMEKPKDVPLLVISTPKSYCFSFVRIQDYRFGGRITSAGACLSISWNLTLEASGNCMSVGHEIVVLNMSPVMLEWKASASEKFW